MSKINRSYSLCVSGVTIIVEHFTVCHPRVWLCRALLLVHFSAHAAKVEHRAT